MAKLTKKEQKHFCEIPKTVYERRGELKKGLNVLKRLYLRAKKEKDKAAAKQLFQAASDLGYFHLIDNDPY